MGLVGEDGNDFPDSPPRLSSGSGGRLSIRPMGLTACVALLLCVLTPSSVFGWTTLEFRGNYNAWNNPSTPPFSLGKQSGANWFTILQVPGDLASDSQHHFKFVGEDSQWKGNGDAWGTVGQTTAEQTFAITADAGNQTITFNAGYYYCYNNDGDNYSIGPGRVRTDGVKSDSTTSDAYREWPDRSVMGLDTRNGEAGDTLHVYWDTTFLYIAFDGFDAANQDFFVAADINGDATGTDYADPWNGGYHFLPFKADYLLTVEDATYKAVRNAMDTEWNNPGDGNIKTNTINSSVGAFSEFKIRWSDLGGMPKTLGIVAWQKWNTQRNITHSWPTQNPAAYTEVGDTLAYYYSWENIHGDSNPRADSTIRRGSAKINEVLWNASATEAYVELYNPRSYPIDISGYTLFDVETQDSYTFPSSTLLGPRNFVLFHPSQGTNYTDSWGIRHFYSATAWDPGGTGASDDSGALELYRDDVLSHDTLADFVTWSNSGSLANSSWDDTAVRARIWSAAAGAIDVQTGSANTDRPLIRKFDGSDSDGVSTGEWVQIGGETTFLAGITNAAGGGPTTITSVSFKDSDFLTDRTVYIPGETIYLVVRATNINSGNTEATVVEINGPGGLDVAAYEYGVNTDSFRAIVRTLPGAATSYSSAEDSLTLASVGGLTARSKTTPSVTDTVLIDTVPYLSRSTYDHRSKELFLYFSRPIDTSTVDVSKFTLQTASGGGSSQNFSGASLKNGSDSLGITVVLTVAQRNSIALWEDSTLFVRIDSGVGSGTSSLSIGTLLSSAARALDSYVPGYDTAVKINEVYPQAGASADSAYIELYFVNNTENGWVDLRNWSAAVREDTLDFSIGASINLGPGDFFLIYRDTGSNDVNMTVGSADTGLYFSGSNFFSQTDYNQVALYRGATRDSSTIVDYLAWRRSNHAGGSMPETQHAVDAGIWTASDSFAYTAAYDTPGSQKSIQLKDNGEDSNLLANWKEDNYTPNKTNRVNDPPTVAAADILAMTGPPALLPGESYAIRIKYSDVNGADSIQRFEFRISNGSDTIWYYSLTGQTPVAVAGSSYVTGSVTIDTSYTGNDVTCTWRLTLGWNFVEASNYVIGARAADNYPETGGWTDSTVLYLYDNDLILSGTLAGSGASNGTVLADTWFQANQTMTWTGLTVYFQNTTLSPKTYFCTFAITDDDSRQTTQTDSFTLNHAKTGDTGRDLSESVAITLLDVPSPGSFDVTTRKFSPQFKIDDSAPYVVVKDETYVFKADTYTRAPMIKVEFRANDSLCLLDTAQYQVDGVWYNVFSADRDSWVDPWRLSEIAYANLETVGLTTVNVRAIDQAGYTVTAAVQIAYEPITINGSVTDWKGDEKMQVDSNENLWFMLAWDDTNVYLAYQPKDISSAGAGDFFVYFDIQPESGLNASINWNGSGTHGLPTDTGAKWDAAFCIEDNGAAPGYEFQQVLDNTAWRLMHNKADIDTLMQTFIGWSGTPVTEIRIPWMYLTHNKPRPDTFNVVAFQQYETDSRIWTSYPTANPGGGSDQNLTFYYQFLQSADTVSPNSVIKQLINIDGGLGEWFDTQIIPAWRQSNLNSHYRVTWDNTFLYFAFSRGDAFPATAANDVIQVYIDTGKVASFGADTGVDWSGTHSIPIKADYVFIYAVNNGGGADYTNLRKWNGSSWVADQTWNGSVAKSSNNGVAEMSIPWKDIGDSEGNEITKLKLLFYTNVGNSGLIWAPGPNGNPGGAAPVILSNYIEYDSLTVALTNPGSYQYTRSTKSLPGGDTKSAPFTPYIDGTKDPGWGDTPDAGSPLAKLPDSSVTANDGHLFPSGRADSIHITNDITNLYLGWHAHGDHYADNDNQTSHYGFILITDSYPAGTSYDPWKSTKTTRVYDYAADFWLMGFVAYATDNFGGMTLYKDNKGVWDTGTPLKAGTDFGVSVGNKWGEAKIPLSTLNVKPGDTVGVIFVARHESNKAGLSDVTPYQAAAVSDWSDNNAALTATSAKVYVIQTSSNTNVYHRPTTEPVSGKGKMRSPLSPTSTDPILMTVGASPVGNFTGLYLVHTKNNWSTTDTLTLTSAFTSGSDEFFRGTLLSNFSKDDTVQYYIKVDEAVDNYVYGTDTLSYVTTSSATAQSNAFTLRILNAVPVSPTSGTVTPQTPVDGSTLSATASGATDKDGDTLFYVFDWFRNHVLQTGLTTVDSTSAYTSSVGADSTSAGDLWYFEIAAGDGRETSAAIRSNAVHLNEYNVWSGTAPIEVNSAAVSDSEWIWTDKTADQRTLPASSKNFDLTQLRLEMDTTDLHFLVYLDGLSNANHPNFAITFDTDGAAGSGNSTMGDESLTALGDSYAAPAPAWESLLVIHTFQTDSPILEIQRGSTWTETISSVSFDTAAFVLKGKIPRQMLGLTGSGQVRCAAGMFKNRLGKAADINSTVEFPVSDALDAVSISGIHGTVPSSNDLYRSMNAYDEEISDADIDFWFQLRYNANGLLANTKPNQPAGPSPANAGSTSDRTPTFSWNASTDSDANDTVTSYLVEIGAAANLEGNVEYRVNLDGDSFSFKPPAELVADSYYWRARTRDRAGALSDSQIWSFTITTPTLGVSRPLDINNVNNMGQSQDLESAYDTLYWQWAPATHSKNWVIQNYFIEVAENPAFDTVLVSDTLNGTSQQGCTTSYQLPAAASLTRGKTYYARIKAGDTASPQNWSKFSEVSDGIYYSMKTVDGDSTDWNPVLGVATNNETFVSGPTREAGWRDLGADQRGDNAAVDDFLDLDEFRISSDSFNLYVYARFYQWQDGAPFIQIALDVNQNSVSRVFQGRNVFAEDDYVNATAAREYIILCRTGNDDLRIVDQNFTTTGYGRYREKSTDKSVELCIPLKYIGGVKEYTSDTVRVTAAVWWNDNGGIGQFGANNSNAVDAITFAASTWGEVSDQVIDHWMSVGFDSMARVSGVKIETAPLTAPPTNPNPGTAYYGAMRDYIIYNVFVDRFWNGNPNNQPGDPDMMGGDFQGLIDQGQYFNDLGINAFQLSASVDYGGGVWGYNQHDLYKVQSSYVAQNWNAYKGWDDYVRLSKEMSRRNISVGLDWVPGQIYGDNNSGGTISKNQKMHFGDRFGGRRVLQYVSDVRQFMVDHARFLYAVGTKLFRVDNPKFYPDPFDQGLPFTAYWNEQLKVFAPDLYSYGEIPDAPGVIGAFVKDGERLTGCLDFNTGYTIKSWANDGAGTSGGGFKDAIEGNYGQYNGAVLPVMVNYYENHDHDRAYHTLSDNMSWNGSVGDMQTLMMWEAAGPGNPCVFYGDERVMMGKKDTTYPGWQYTQSTSQFGNTRKFPWDYDGATGDIQNTVGKAFKARDAFPGLRFDQASVYWLKADGDKPISFRRGSGTGEEVIVLINPNDADYNFLNVSASAANTWYKDWFTGGEIQSDANGNIASFNVGANYAAFLKRNRFGLATLNVTVRTNAGVRPKAIVSLDRKSSYTKETNVSGQCTINDIVTAKSGTTGHMLRVWYPGYNAYNLNWNFTDGQTLTADINLDTDPSAGPDAVAPATPVGLMAVARDRAVVLDWTDNTEGDIESYYIYRSTTPNNPTPTMIMEVVESTFFDNNLDDKLINGTTYYYKVRARDYNDNVSGYSTEIAVTPNPAYVTIQVDMTNSGFNVTNLYLKGNAYNLTRSDFNTGFKNSEIDPLVKMDLKGRNIWEKTVPFDPTMNINYIFVCNHNNGTQWFDEFGFWNAYSFENARGFTVPNTAGDTYPLVHVWMTGGDVAPQAPQGLTAVGQNGLVKLGWSLNLEADIDRYELWRSTDNVNFDVITNVGKNVINYTDLALSNGTTYYYKMKAADRANNFSGFSATVQAAPASTTDTTAPAKPAGLSSLNAGLNTIVLKWSYNTEGDLAGYNVYRNTTATFTPAAANKLNVGLIPSSLDPQWIDSTAQTGVQYYYTVTASDDFKNESDSAAVLAVKLARLTFQVDMGTINTGGNVKITANDNFITGAGKNMSDSGAYTWITTTDFIVGRALEYKYATFETTEIDFNTTSRKRELTVPDVASATYVNDWQEEPDAVTGVTGQPDSGAAWIFWTANSADKDLSGYNVYKQESSGSFTKINTSVITVTNYKVTGLTNGTTYSFAVRAVDSGDLALESPNSNVINITPGAYVDVDFRN